MFSIAFKHSTILFEIYTWDILVQLSLWCCSAMPMENIEGIPRILVKQGRKDECKQAIQNHRPFERYTAGARR